MVARVRKGIILAGGRGSRLYPLTMSCNKHLLPIYDKPMIYYPLCTLMLAGIRDILLIADPDYISQFQALIGDGSQWGVKVSYAAQDEPRGLADAFLVGESFIDGQPVALTLGDNIFHGSSLSRLLADAASAPGCNLFAIGVKDPTRYGVVEIDADNRALSLEEKPKAPKSHLAVVGLYFYDEKVVSLAKTLKPSVRGELEITDLNNLYLAQGDVTVHQLPRGMMWLDVGLPSALAEASNYVETVQSNQGTLLCSPEEVALHMEFISPNEFAGVVDAMPKCEYKDFLTALTV